MDIFYELVILNCFLSVCTDLYWHVPNDLAKHSIYPCFIFVSASGCNFRKINDFSGSVRLKSGCEKVTSDLGLSSCFRTACHFGSNTINYTPSKDLCEILECADNLELEETGDDIDIYIKK